MLYSDDVYLAIIRSPIMEYGVSSWTSLHIDAARRFEQDIDRRWYRSDSLSRGIDWMSTPFDSSKLLQGFNYIAVGVVDVANGDIVVCPSSHTSGGTPGNYYQAQSNLGSTNLTNEDLTSSDWADVTSDRIQFRMLVTCYAFFLAYRYLANKEKDDDYADQREYWLGQYYMEFDRQLSLGIDYDYDGDGVIDSSEKSSGYPRMRIKRV